MFLGTTMIKGRKVESDVDVQKPSVIDIHVEGQCPASAL